MYYICQPQKSEENLFGLTTTSKRMSWKGLSSSTAQLLVPCIVHILQSLQVLKKTVIQDVCESSCPDPWCKKLVKPYFLFLNKAAHFIVTKSFVLSSLSKTSNKQISHGKNSEANSPVKGWHVLYPHVTKDIQSRCLVNDLGGKSSGVWSVCRRRCSRKSEENEKKFLSLQSQIWKVFF